MNHGHGKSLNQVALSATLHCLTGCAVGEVLGLVIGTAVGLSNTPTVVLATSLAFLFGYLFTILPLMRGGIALVAAIGLAFASDTFSIAAMEVGDNTTMLIIPGAMNAGLTNPLFWVAMPVSLAIGGLIAFPVNRWLITRGKGHAVVHAHHERHH